MSLWDLGVWRSHPQGGLNWSFQFLSRTTWATVERISHVQSPREEEVEWGQCLHPSVPTKGPFAKGAQEEPWMRDVPFNSRMYLFAAQRQGL